MTSHELASLLWNLPDAPIRLLTQAGEEVEVKRVLYDSANPNDAGNPVVILWPHDN